jgi:hypothetical protein
VRLTLKGVSDDSRCPVDVTCMWEGDAKVSVEVITPSPRAQHELHTAARESREAEHGAYRITLVKLEPAPRSTATISQADYRATSSSCARIQRTFFPGPRAQRGWRHEHDLAVLPPLAVGVRAPDPRSSCSPSSCSRRAPPRRGGTSPSQGR